MEPHYYNTRIEWEAGRHGVMSSPELTDKLRVATPPNFKGGEVDIWSPEHLFTAAINSCFMTTFLAIAENSGLKFSTFSCDAKGKLEMIGNAYLMTEVDLNAQLTIENGGDKERASRILEKSEKACLITNSTKAKVNLHSTISVQPYEEIVRGAN